MWVDVGVGVATIFSTTGLRPSSLNEFDGFREIGDANGGSRDFWSTRGLHPREKKVEESLAYRCPSTVTAM